jgi:Fe-S-cluster containining protein
MEAMGLEVDEEDGRQLLLQPCSALDGTRCTIYQHRPDCCRTFECALLIRHRSGQLTKENARAKIHEVKHLAEAAQITEALTLIDQHFLTLPES